jgi:dihydroorotate dehydrogenase (fumarate)
MDLTTTYLGINLRTPLVPSASPFSEDLDKIKQMEQAGASAVVLHSLFEEQIEAARPEFRLDPKTYLEHIAQAKRTVGIPIIASLNCTTLGGWISYARRITEAGADALELNIYKIHLAHTALAASMEGAGQDQSPVAADETNLLEGARLYQQNDCMRCHGAFGQGATALSKLM